MTFFLCQDNAFTKQHGKFVAVQSKIDAVDLCIFLIILLQNKWGHMFFFEPEEKYSYTLCQQFLFETAFSKLRLQEGEHQTHKRTGFKSAVMSNLKVFR